MTTLFKLLLALLIVAIYVDYQGMQFPLFVRLMESLGVHHDLYVSALVGWLLLPLLGYRRRL